MQGRARARRNALRHGLSIPMYSDPAWSAELEALAREIVGSKANAETQEPARQIAEAQIDLRCVRFARYRLLSEALSNPHCHPRASVGEEVKLMRSLLPRGVQNTPVAALEKLMTSATELPENLAIILSEKAKQLLTMERYERRALSRRNSAIRAFDAARARAATTASQSPENLKLGQALRRPPAHRLSNNIINVNWRRRR
jgi:hypothetical protein